MSINEGDLIAIEWWDSESNPDGHAWVDKDDADLHEPITTACTVGHVAAVSSHQITVAASDGRSQWGQVITIPTMAVKRFGKVTVKWEDEDAEADTT